MTSAYAKNQNCKQFVLNGCFQYNVNDMSILSNTNNMFPYLICYQDEILKAMGQFFSGHTFEASYMEAIIDNKNLSIEFKKEFVFVCGGSLVNLVGIETKLAVFITDNNNNKVEITEPLVGKLEKNIFNEQYFVERDVLISEIIKLPIYEQKLLYMKFWENYSYSEIAEILKSKKSTIHRQTASIIKKLMTILKE